MRSGPTNDILLIVTLSSFFPFTAIIATTIHSPPRMKLDVGKVLQAGVMDEVSWEKRKVEGGAPLV